MENAVVPFPLVRLPFSVQQRVTKNMDCIAQLIFSIVSKKTKFLLKSLKVKINFVVLKFHILAEIALRFSDDAGFRVWLGYGPGRRNIISMEETPYVTNINWMEGPSRNVKFNCDLIYREWILHIFDVYHEIRIRDFELSIATDDYDITSIKTALRGIETPTLVVKNVDNEGLLQNVTRQFPSIKRLDINDYRAENKDRLQQVLLSNFYYFRVFEHSYPYYASLDRFLTINASTIAIPYSRMTDRMLNRFLKLWMRGAMPRLQRLVMDFRQNNKVLKKNVILNGVHYNERGQDQGRSGLFEDRNGPETMTLRGDLSIMRCDGTEATIKMYESGDEVVNFKFYVWSE